MALWMDDVFMSFICYPVVLCQEEQEFFYLQDQSMSLDEVIFFFFV